MTREVRIGAALVAALGAFIFFLMVVGSGGGTRPEIDPLSVSDVLSGGPPANRYGSGELHISGWYAELAADCEGDDGGADPSVAWLQRDCPLRVLLPEQPDEDVTQEELIAQGIRLAAPLGNAFPSRAEPTGPNRRGQQLVFVGHFDDATAAQCVPERQARCENTFVVSDYDELLR